MVFETDVGFPSSVLAYTDEAEHAFRARTGLLSNSAVHSPLPEGAESTISVQLHDQRREVSREKMEANFSIFSPKLGEKMT